MIVFLDTSICVLALRRSCPWVGERVKSMSAELVKVPTIVMAELILGAFKSPRPGETMQAVREFLRPFETVPFCSRCAMEYGRLRADLERRGISIGPNDMIIAATVLAHGGTLVTHNLREFRRVAGLGIEDWTE